MKLHIDLHIVVQVLERSCEADRMASQSTQSLAYVTPLEPHTGAKLKGHPGAW